MPNRVGGFSELSRLNELFDVQYLDTHRVDVSDMMVVELKPDERYLDAHRTDTVLIELKLPVLSMPTGSLSLDTP